jgi:hypothetical protein
VVVCPYEWFALFRKIEKRSCEFRVVFDESSVEVAETEEFLDVFNGLGSRPIFNCFKFDQIHA